MRALYARLLNRHPLAIPAAVFVVVLYLLLPLAGEYAAIIALLAAAKSDGTW